MYIQYGARLYLTNMDMTTIAIIIIVALLLQGVGLWFMFGRTKNPEKVEDNSGLLLLQQQLQDLVKSVDTKLGEGNKTMSDSMRD